MIVYNKLKIVGRWDFTADKPLDDAAIATINAEVAKIGRCKKITAILVILSAAKDLV